jgi:hypothetical protein
MKTVEIPDAAFRKLEALRRAKKVTRAEALTQAINQAAEVMRWERDIERRSSKAAQLSGEEADRLATEVVREARRKRRK